jgi:tetratricopeptide (TPR) repeat protein
MARELSELRSGWSDDEGLGRTLTDEEIQRLESLGYAHVGGGRNDEALPDPKAMIDLYNQAMDAEDLYAQRRYTEAAALAREVSELCEMCTNARRVLAFSQLRLGRPSAAVALLRESVERNRDVYLVRSLAQVLIMNGDFAEAEEVLQLYEEIVPDDGRIAILRGDCLDRQGHPQQAIAEYENAARLDPNRVGIQAAERIARVRARAGADPGS